MIDNRCSYLIRGFDVTIEFEIRICEPSEKLEDIISTS